MKKSSCLKLQALVKSLDILYHLVDLNQVCSNYAPGGKNGPAPGGPMFSIVFNI